MLYGVRAVDRRYCDHPRPPGSGAGQSVIWVGWPAPGARGGSATDIRRSRPRQGHDRDGLAGAPSHGTSAAVSTGWLARPGARGSRPSSYQTGAFCCHKPRTSAGAPHWSYVGMRLVCWVICSQDAALLVLDICTHKFACNGDAVELSNPAAKSGTDQRVNKGRQRRCPAREDGGDPDGWF